MKSLKISACLDRPEVIDDLNELYEISERADRLVLKLRKNQKPLDDGHSALSVQAIICRLETAAQLLRNLQS